MIKKYWVLFAAIVMSATLLNAVRGSAEIGSSPALYFTDPSTGIEMVYVKGACYQMGDTFGDGELDEKPAHEVCVDDFYVGKYEVTQGQWKNIMGSNPSYFISCGDNCPVDNVSWNEAQAFISRLNSKKNGNSYRLPTEAEFEYAQRSGGKGERFSGGNDVDSVAWYNVNSNNENKPVGAKAPNGLGLYDMSGNVWEWTNDWYDSNYYLNSPRNNPQGPVSGIYRVMRGGCSGGPTENQKVVRRGAFRPDDRKAYLGFRLARTP